MITWRISSRAEISDRLLKQILWKPNCRLHGEGFSQKAQHSKVKEHNILRSKLSLPGVQHFYWWCVCLHYHDANSSSPGLFSRWFSVCYLFVPAVVSTTTVLFLWLLLPHFPVGERKQTLELESMTAEILYSLASPRFVNPFTPRSAT